MTNYDMDMLNWLAEVLDKAASMARVRTTLHNMLPSPVRDEMLRMVTERHTALTAEMMEALRAYLRTGPAPQRGIGDNQY